MLLLLPLCGGLPFTSNGASKHELEEKVQQIICAFSPRLGVTVPVIVSIVPRNPRLISVEYARGRTDLFQMMFEEGFLRALNETELRAAVAHEMGHIWIYTHFPFLQTETLANRQALKLVARSDLAAVYERVWERNKEKGNLAAVLDPEKGSGKGTRGGVFGLDQSAGGNVSGTPAPRGPAIYFEANGSARNLTGISPSVPDAPPVSVPDIVSRLSRDCPACSISASRRNADYIVAFNMNRRGQVRRWVWLIHSKDGSLVKKGEGAMAANPAREISAAIKEHWRGNRW